MSKRLDYNQIAPEGLEALGGVHGYIAQSSLPATLVDLVYLRVSQQLRLLPRHAHVLAARDMAAERRRAAALDRRHHLQDSACRGRVYLDQKEQDHEQLDD